MWRSCDDAAPLAVNPCLLLVLVRVLLVGLFLVVHAYAVLDFRADPALAALPPPKTAGWFVCGQPDDEL